MRIGLDIGGTKVAAALVGADNELHAQSWHEHSARGVESVAQELAATVRSLPDAAPTHPIGISVSGLVRRDGTVTGGATLDLHGDLAAALGTLLPNPARVFNDAEATLRSVREDILVSSGEHLRDAVLLTIGTGIGGALIVDGRPVRGRDGLATELGHLPIMAPTSHRCVCGSSGCLEQYAGGMGMAALAQREVNAGTASASLARHAAIGDALTARDVVSAARAGDATSLALIDQAAGCIAQAIRALCVTVEPAVVLLGGSVAHGAADLLPDRISRELQRHWPFAALTSPPSVQLDSIGPYAGAIGAAMLAGTGAISDLDQL